MPDKEIDEPVDLRIIDEKQLESEYRKIERALRLAQKVERTQRKLAAGVAPIQAQHTRTEKTLPAGFSKVIPAGEFLHPSARRLAQGRAPLATVQAVQKQKRRQQNFEKLRERFGFKEAKNVTQETLSLIRDPVGFIAQSLPQILRIAGPAAIAVFAFEVAKQVFELFKSQFGAGGLFDIRKLVLDQVRTVSTLQTLVNIQSGIVFFTSDAGQRLRQGAPQFSNTMQLRENYRRFQLLHLGE
jgi:hypothetical protein